MEMPSTDFLTRKQMKEQIALPKVGVTYSDGKGASRSFGVSDASELGSLDAAFGAAAAGARDKNLDLAKMLNGGDKLKPMNGSAVHVDNGTIYLEGETSGGQRGKLFFGTDKTGNKGWHAIENIDTSNSGDLVGKTQNVEAKSDEGKREIGKSSGSWSIEVSRTAFKVNNDTGVVSFYNYFKTLYFSEMGRVIGSSAEKEVLVGSFSSKTFDEKYVFCAKPETEQIGEDVFVTGLALAKPSEFRAVSEGREYVDRLQAEYDEIKDDPLINPVYIEEVREKLESAKEVLQNAEKHILHVTIGKYSVRGVFTNGILSSLLFGKEIDVDQRPGDTTKVNRVDTVVGCPHRTS